MVAKSRIRATSEAMVETIGCGSKPFWDPILLVGEFTTHFKIYFSGGWDVHWGVRDFDPWQLFAGIYRGMIIPGSLRWCEMDLVHPQ